VYGPLINELARTGGPVAYVTVGQNVPKDILRPSARKMVKLALQPDPEGWDKFVSLPKATKPRSKTKSKAKVRKAANEVCH
jgi:hypothetical protein